MLLFSGENYNGISKPRFWLRAVTIFPCHRDGPIIFLIGLAITLNTGEKKTTTPGMKA